MRPGQRTARTARTAGMLAAAGLLLTACTVPRPMVTFYGNRAAVSVQPELWCTVNTTALTVACPPSPDTANDGHLRMAPGQPVQISVPGDVGNTPWLVVFEYLDPAGKPQNGRSALFSDDQLAYTLPPLGVGSRFTRVEVQSGLVPTLAANGSTVITASRTWVLVVHP